MKKLFVSLCALLAAVALTAAVRTPEQAAQLAAEFTNGQPTLARMHKLARTSSDMTLAHTFTKPQSTEAAVYAFNQEDDKGFVLVSADDRTMDILCYSDRGTFDLETANPNFLWWVKRYTQEIANVNDENAYTGGSMVRRVAQTTAISPLLGNIAWDQETPYNNKCPMDLYYTSERCYTGCVATACAQIMRFWQYPATGTGSHSYTLTCYNSAGTKSKSGTITQDFSTITFDWANMLETYGSSYTTAQGNAVATLMYACGVACDMQYGGETIGGSGAWTDDMGYGLITYFGYNPSTAKFITTYSKSEYEGNNGRGESTPMTNCAWSQSTTQITTAFNTELEAGRPILMGGEDGSNGGHEFVCDGRDANGKFHINWGWSGESNCYVALSSLKPSSTSYNFSDEIDAVVGIQPGVVDTVHVTGLTVSPTSATIKINGKQQLTATVAPTDATVKTVSWTSSNSNVATVSSTGLVKGIAAGTATITCKTTDGSKTATATITVTNETEASTAFTLVTDASSLSVGDEVLLVNRDNNLAMSTTQNTNNRGTASVTISNDQIELEDDQTDVQVFTLKAGKASGQWAFYTGSNYIYAASSSKNQLKESSALTTDGSWTVSISSGDATITAQGSNTHNVIRYNSNNNSPIFSCYSSTGTVNGAVSLFARTPASPATGLSSVQEAVRVEKFFENGKLMIRKGGHVFDVTGRLVY